jgi:polyphosphate kinase
MPRNFDRRVELMVPVEDPASRDRLLDVLRLCMADTVNAWVLRPDGAYERIAVPERKGRVRSQEALYRQACARVASALRSRRTMFEPHRPKNPSR